jgi:oligopeptide/dipeptide ABC transporter ATP-binding protein
VLAVERLVTELWTRQGALRVVDGVSLEIAAGEIVALVGESGSGKSFTARSIAGLLPDFARISDGAVRLHGVDLVRRGTVELPPARRREIGFVFQDPSTHLNPLMRIGDQVVESVRMARPEIAKGDAQRRAVELLETVRIADAEQVVGRYPHQLSGGMRQRVLIAMALAGEPLLLIGDEPTAALDVTIQAQILGLLQTLRHELGVAILLITHDFGLVAELCDRVYVMYGARIAETGHVEQLFAEAGHPYTQALLASFATGERGGRIEAIKGGPPSLAAPPTGCRFHPRCPSAMDICRRRQPPPFPTESGHAACWLRGEPQEEAA